MSRERARADGRYASTIVCFISRAHPQTHSTFSPTWSLWSRTATSLARLPDANRSPSQMRCDRARTRQRECGTLDVSLAIARANVVCRLHGLSDAIQHRRTVLTVRAEVIMEEALALLYRNDLARLDEVSSYPKRGLIPAPISAARARTRGRLVSQSGCTVDSVASPVCPHSRTRYCRLAILFSLLDNGWRAGIGGRHWLVGLSRCFRTDGRIITTGNETTCRTLSSELCHAHDGWSIPLLP